MSESNSILQPRSKTDTKKESTTAKTTATTTTTTKKKSIDVFLGHKTCKTLAGGRGVCVTHKGCTAINKKNPKPSYVTWDLKPSSHDLEFLCDQSKGIKVPIG